MDRNTRPSPRLEPHSRIAVVGGGPSGSLFALHALQFASSINLPIEIVIFERKDLTAVGPRGCNMCAGILSRRVTAGLAQLAIEVPSELVLGIVRFYRVHWRGRAIAIEAPDRTRRVLSVYRAGGPRKSPYRPAAGLDEFLLTQAVARGARVLHERVEDVSFLRRPLVRTNGREEEFDLVVLACGVNSTPPAFHNNYYLHPQVETMAQDALLIDTDTARIQMDSTVHIFFDQPRRLIFGALVPKGHFATISLLGQNLERDCLQQFLSVPEVQQVIGAAPPQMCGCRPHVAVGEARGNYAERFVAVGDACVTRLYKDGIGSALVTARAAAETAILHGVGQADFENHYAPTIRAISRDNFFGSIVFGVIAQSKRNRFVMSAVAHRLDKEATLVSTSRVLGATLWSLFTGDANYARILTMLLDPRLTLRLLAALLHGLIQRQTVAAGSARKSGPDTRYMKEQQVD